MIRKWFLNPCAAAIFLCGFAPGAPAADTNQPLPVWVVGPIQAKGDDGTGYCSMKNSYRDGQTLVFARDENGSNSIAVDFKEDMLEAGRLYKVFLNVGGLKRKVMATAATSQVAVMQIGRDKSFYGALGRKNSLALNLAGEKFTFGLAGAAEALKILDDCTESLYSAEKVAEAAAPPPEEKLELPPVVGAGRKKISNASGWVKRLVDADTSSVPAAPAATDSPPVAVAATKDFLQGILEASHIADGKIESSLAGGRPYYRWMSGRIYGDAQEISWDPGLNFSQMADGYLQQSATFCRGNFMRTMDNIRQAGDIKIQEAKMTCLDPHNNNVAAAVLFVANRDRFGVITQEGTIDQLPDVLAKRDSIVSVVLGN